MTCLRTFKLDNSIYCCGNELLFGLYFVFCPQCLDFNWIYLHQMFSHFAEKKLLQISHRLAVNVARSRLGRVWFHAHQRVCVVYAVCVRHSRLNGSRTWSRYRCFTCHVGWWSSRWRVGWTSPVVTPASGTSSSSVTSTLTSSKVCSRQHVHVSVYWSVELHFYSFRDLRLLVGWREWHLKEKRQSSPYSTKRA